MTDAARPLTSLPRFEPANEPFRARICIATPEVIGPYKCGGIGTLYTTLAESLAAAGHEVTLLYLRGSYSEKGTLSEWVETYREKNIRLVALPRPIDTTLHGALSAVTAFHAYTWLKENPFDIVHFPELAGPAHYALVAKRHGLGFENTLFVVGTHGPTLWVRDANNEPLHDLYDLENDFVERQSVALADVVWGPSQYLFGWMREQGWETHERCHVQPYILPQAARSAPSDDDERRRAVEELVFFGRLETRKGLELFCDALDELASRGSRDFSVTFMGRNWQIGQEDSISYIQRRAAGWPWSWKTACDWNQPEAIGYLQSGGKLAVMPSFMDNSPNTVYECLGAGVPFIAGDSGGIPELIHPDEAEDVCFTLEPQALATRIQDALRAGARRVRPAVAFDDNEAHWMEWHRETARRLHVDDGGRSASTTRTRPTLRTDVIMLPKASDHEATSSAQWNAGRAESSADAFLFVDPRYRIHDGAIETLERAAARSGADVLTTWTQELDPDAADAEAAPVLSTHLPLGGTIAVGAFINCFGRGPVWIRRDAFDAIAGFPEGSRGTLDFVWGLCSKAVLSGRTLEVVPEALFSEPLRDEPDSRKAPYPDHSPTLQAIAETMPSRIASLVLTGASLKRLADTTTRRRTVSAAENPVDTLLSAGRFLADRGATEASLRVLSQARDLSNQLDRPVEQVQVSLLTAYAHVRAGSSYAAKNEALHAIELSSRSGSPPSLFEAFLRVAEITSLIGEHETSSQLYLEAFRHARALRKPQALIETLTSAGSAHVAMNQPAMAQSMWQTAKKLAERNDFPVALGRVNELLASLDRLPSTTPVGAGSA